MTRTRFTNTMDQSSKANLEWQLRNVEAALHKHPLDSAEALYLAKERQILLERLEGL